MALTNEQRVELDKFGSANVRMKLAPVGPGRGAIVHGFENGLLTRGDVEDWLAQKNLEETTERQRTLRWAIIAGVAAIAGVLVGIAALVR